MIQYLNAVICFAVSLFLPCVPLLSQSQHEQGRYLIRNYSPEEYDGHPQNWVIAEDHRGVMYFGNSIGLLEYDGITWRQLRVPGRIVRSIDVDHKGRVYVGSSGNFGYLAPDSTGSLSFISLLTKVDSSLRNFSNVWHTLAIGDTIYFITYSGVFRYSGNKIHVWKAKTRFQASFVADGRMYVSQSAIGLFTPEGDSLKFVPGSQTIGGEGLFMVEERPEGLLLGSDPGFFILKDGEYTKSNYGAGLTRLDIYRSAALTNGTTAFTSLTKGVIILDKHGHQIAHLNKSGGLATNDVKGAFRDSHGALWLAMNHGVARVDLHLPMTVFEAAEGLEGAVESMVRFGGTLYAATNAGVFRLQKESTPSRPARFIKIEALETQAFWLCKTKNELLGRNRQWNLAHRPVIALAARVSSCYRHILRTSSEPPLRRNDRRPWPNGKERLELGKARESAWY